MNNMVINMDDITIIRNNKGQFAKGSISKPWLGKKRNKSFIENMNKKVYSKMRGNTNPSKKENARHKIQQSKIGNKNPMWKGGFYIDSHGYKHVRINGKYISEHRHIMETHINRKLKKHEVVHHKDNNKLNNQITNLEITTSSQNSKYHHRDVKIWRDFYEQHKNCRSI